MSITDRLTYNCPTWCERTDHHADDLSEGGPVYHYGPEFGIILAQQDGDGEREVSILEPITFVGALSAAGLHKVAQDALAAAEWLEQVQG